MTVAALGSEAELRLAVCFWFRLFYVAPETTARFTYSVAQRRILSSPCVAPCFEVTTTGYLVGVSGQWGFKINLDDLGPLGRRV